MIISEWNHRTKKYEKHHYICACRDCEIKEPNEKIPKFYSYEHAENEGWRFTDNDIRFKDPETPGRVAVCPNCLEKLGLK